MASHEKRQDADHERPREQLLGLDPHWSGNVSGDRARFRRSHDCEQVEPPVEPHEHSLTCSEKDYCGSEHLGQHRARHAARREHEERH